MAALKKLCHMMGINLKKLTKQDICILEAELYIRIHQKIWEAYKAQHKDDFYLIRTNFEKEDTIVDLYVIRFLINDLLKNEAYTLSGIALYTNTPEEIIENLLIGHKISYMNTFTRRLIELHKLDRPDIYQALLSKLTFEKQEERRNCHDLDDEMNE